ncbi:AGAP000833-PA-like protein [Anopheles sinensis]|uniref:AGAP000833-PA-like protein n=1 Tax=Anopheles sinensis TaxID=74873 RepID=A0A084VQ73_ANOSI|nr:AGAP000833-PA-like protein [Anopheles sinensis]
MKALRCILSGLVIMLMSVLHCSGQSSEEHALANVEMGYSELDRGKPPLGNLNGLLESLARSGNGESMGALADTDDPHGSLAVPADYDTAEGIAARLGYARHNGDAKRSWNKMNAAWGKRVTNGARNAGWTRFGGAWGKREPGWNNLKGLWGKRADNKWDKLSSAWGKRQQTSGGYQ